MNGREPVAGDRRLPLRYAQRWLLLGRALILAVIVLSLMPTTQTPELAHGDKLGHLLAYGVLMFWFAGLYRRGYWPRLAIGFILLGVALEYLQGLTGYRSYDPLDMLANSLGVAVGAGLALTPLAHPIGWLDHWLASHD